MVIKEGMSDAAAVRMTANEFIAWAMKQPEGRHYELVGGEVIAMAPGRSGHALAKANVWRRLNEAAEAVDLPCDVYPDGMAVTIHSSTVYEPDVLVRCGPCVPDDAVRLDDPVIVVEILSPSPRSKDSGAKLIDYIRLPSIQRYLIVRDGTLRLDPPGL